MITRITTNMNGITIAYVMGLVNAAFAAMLAFGIHLSDVQIASLGTLINASLILCVHISHRVGEALNSGASTSASAAAHADTQPANG